MVKKKKLIENKHKGRTFNKRVEAAHRPKIREVDQRTTNPKVSANGGREVDRQSKRTKNEID